MLLKHYTFHVVHSCDMSCIYFFMIRDILFSRIFSHIRFRSRSTSRCIATLRYSCVKPSTVTAWVCRQCCPLVTCWRCWWCTRSRYRSQAHVMIGHSLCSDSNIFPQSYDINKFIFWTHKPNHIIVCLTCLHFHIFPLQIQVTSSRYDWSLTVFR